MRGIVFDGDVKRYAGTLLLGKVSKKLSYGGPACTGYRENIKEPELPGPDWVKVKTSFGGICGSDLNLVYLHDSPSASPFVSFPFVIGHENMGVIAETGSGVEGFEPGDRVIADPILSCRVRGIEEECESCRSGNPALCSNFTKGVLPPGMSIGSCRDTGGSWGEYYIAHKSQLIKLGDDIKGEAAVLVDAIASALHPVARNYPGDGEKVLVVGSGIIGLMVVACLRALGSKCSVTILAKHRFQGELAEKYGADNVVYTRDGDYYTAFAGITGGTLYKPIVGKRVMTGGFDRVFECVGSDISIDESLRFTKQGGTMVLIGLASAPRGVDWTPIWLKEIKLHGAYWCGTENLEGRTASTYNHTLRLIREGRLDVGPLVTHILDIKDYRKAIEIASEKGKYKSIKVLFGFSAF
ncbi:MAG TPA: alcohol dehydrogenase catalytic domain-containing protein [Clostridia bacterium]|nr:alcohol dehydrogenase catalytic domain-containing protein [Clostridia bacterium]